MFDVSNILATEGLKWENEGGVTLHLLENNPKDKIFTSNEKKIVRLLESLNSLEVETMRDLTPNSWNNIDEVDIVRQIFDGGSFAILATVNEAVAGIGIVGSWLHNGDYGGSIHYLIVEKKYRGSGIGRAILDKILHIAKERDFEYIGLGHNALNDKAAKLYDSLGFKPTYISRELVLRR